MSLLVLAFPKFKDSDFNWIQGYRKKYDKLFYSVVNPHFTIVFPTFNVTEKDFIKEVIIKCKDQTQITFIIRSAVINKDSFIDTYHEFLVPDEGHSQIIKLHDKLYSGKLFPKMKLDIDFIPHIGIGNSKDPMMCRKNADEINNSNIEIPGTIETLDIVSYDNNKVEPLGKIELQHN